MRYLFHCNFGFHLSYVYTIQISWYFHRKSFPCFEDAPDSGGSVQDEHAKRSQTTTPSCMKLGQTSLLFLLSKSVFS